MSRLILMRHGQASFTGEVYDALSPIGFEQAAHVGRWWRDNRPRPDAVWIGPLRRHRETAEGAAQPGWPEPRVDRRLDEFADRDAILDAPAARALLREQRSAELRARLHAYAAAIEAWCAGTVQLPGTPPIEEFRIAVARWLEQTFAAQRSGATVLAVTSAGVIATAVAVLLDAPNRAIPRVLRVLRNASMSEVLYSGEVRSLNSINDVQPLPAALHTLL